MHSEGLKWRALEGHCAKVPQAVDAGLEALEGSKVGAELSDIQNKW